MAQQEIRKFDSLLQDFNTAMLVTRTPAGELRSRPMAIADQESGGNLLFGTSLDSAKVNEILEDERVNVSLQGIRKFMSLSGDAELVTDDDTIKDAWTPAWEAYFPEGPESDEFVVIRVKGETGEYWNYGAGEAFEFTLEAGKALLTGESMIGSIPADHDTVELAES